MVEHLLASVNKTWWVHNHVYTMHISKQPPYIAHLHCTYTLVIYIGHTHWSSEFTLRSLSNEMSSWTL